MERKEIGTVLIVIISTMLLSGFAVSQYYEDLNSKEDEVLFNVHVNSVYMSQFDSGWQVNVTYDNETDHTQINRTIIIDRVRREGAPMPELLVEPGKDYKAIALGYPKTVTKEILWVKV